VDDPDKLEARLKEVQARGRRLAATVTTLNRTLKEPELKELREEYSRLHARWVIAKSQRTLF
jgi:hypothetical protein